MVPTSKLCCGGVGVTLAGTLGCQPACALGVDVMTLRLLFPFLLFAG